MGREIDPLKRELPKMKSGKSKKRLAFDSETCELIVLEEESGNDNQVVIDQIYKDGFFALAG